MKWREILVGVFNYLKKHRAVWYLGILASLTEGTNGLFQFDQNSNSDSKISPDFFQGYFEKLTSWVSQNTSETILIIITLFIIGLIILYISYSARAGAIHAVDKSYQSDDKVNFHTSFHSGQKFFWRFLGVSLVIALLIFAVAFVLFGFVAILVIIVASINPWFLILLIPLGLMLIFGLVMMIIYLTVVQTFAFREIVIKDKKITQAIKGGESLVHHHFSNVFFAWLIELAIGVVAGMVSAVVMIILGAILFAIGSGIYFAGGLTITIIYALVFGLALLALMIAISGYINAYVSTFWTVVYKKLI